MKTYKQLREMSSEKLGHYTNLAFKDAIRRSALHALNQATSGAKNAIHVPPKFGDDHPVEKEHRVATGRNPVTGEIYYGREGDASHQDKNDNDRKDIDVIEKRKKGIERATKILTKRATLHEESRHSILENFIQYAKGHLNISELPSIEFDSVVEHAKAKKTMATYSPSEKHIWLYEGNRNLADILRSLAHELTHHKQNEDGRLYHGAGEAGTEIENEANAMAGVMLREYGRMNSEIYESVTI